ncbi:MFS transporter [Streptomyces sp. NPDC006700]|uniref:MFS transporter n=1 Tax=unclassified Streptomyces TaxID=2593676 RepID=UPI0033E8A239
MAINPLSPAADPLHERATRKALVRLLPIMLAAYFMAYVDRTNVALAKTHLQADVGVGVTAFGLGAGIFFVSYAFLEVPSSLVMHRIGPRRWIARIALTWGALSAAMMFVQGAWSFYALRFFLGMAEAGLYPTLMYMVTVWFSQKHRATVVGFVYLAPTVALIVGNPMGGALMELDSVLGLHGWQWMFLIEGLVTMLVGVLVWFSLPEAPRDAKWLTSEEAGILSARAAGDGSEGENRIKGNLKQAFGRPFIVIVAVIYLLNQITNVGIVFNLPSIVEDLNIHGSFLIGLVSGSSGIGATVGVLLVPVVHRRFGNEVALIGILAGATAVTAAIFVVSSSPAVQITLIAVSMIFVFGTLPLFWSVAMARMSGLVAAAGLAFINTIGLLGGFLGPYAFGLAEDATGNPGAGLWVVIACSVAGVLLTPLLANAVRDEDAAEAPVPVSP